ncbi:hypothetical protein [Ammoniphilus sp. CFH 90114]|uniref:hypothetical protein n=1 Tax=Ammoniphilus sp. CFH 90114 TaxID=2493665 RepID=UPI0013E8F5C7|nr:hypothetical protein [Ammoniphilus sp. CFH 90114]
MDGFRRAVDDLIFSWSKVNEEWDELDEDMKKFVIENYPFNDDLREVLHKLFDWRGSF